MNKDFYYDLSSIIDINDFIMDDKVDSNILNKRICITKEKNQKYNIIGYNKTILSKSLIPTYGLFRSIVINNKNKVVSFSPPKSIPTEDFIKKYNLNSHDIIIEEFIEGTMVNVFWDPDSGTDGGWEISTRNKVGAETCFFYNTKTFRSMFFEALSNNNLNLDILNPDYCYSFVLQHPDNRIVVPIIIPQLYLVGVYCIIQNLNLLHVYSFINNLKKDIMWKSTSVRFPQQYFFNNYSDLIDTYASMNTSYSILGVVIHNLITGERCKIRNPVYEQVRQLKGNQPKLQYQYLVLRNQGRVSEYLKYYPEVINIFSIFRDQLHLFTNTLFSNYISCYIKKEKKLIEYSLQYRTHMFKIHSIFLNELREKQLFITKYIVIRYVNELHPSQLMFSINYPMRKRNIEFNTGQTKI